MHAAARSCRGTGARALNSRCSGSLIATTLIAAAIGGLEALRPTIVQDRGQDFAAFSGEIPRTPQQVREIVLAASVALSAIGGLWVVTRPGAAWFRLGAMLLALPIVALYLAYMAAEADQRMLAAVNLGLGLALVAGLTGLTVLPLRLLDYRLKRPAAARASGVAATSLPGRLVSRGAAVAVIVALAAMLPLSKPLSRGVFARLSPPATAFAAWIKPRDRLALQKTYRLRLRSISVQRLRTIQFSGRYKLEPRPLEIPAFPGGRWLGIQGPIEGSTGGPLEDARTRS